MEYIKLYLNFISLTLTRVTGGTGGYDGSDRSDEILELRDDASWVKIGQMKNARSFFGLSKVDVQNFDNRCQ